MTKWVVFFEGDNQISKHNNREEVADVIAEIMTDWFLPEEAAELEEATKKAFTALKADNCRYIKIPTVDGNIIAHEVDDDGSYAVYLPADEEVVLYPTEENRYNDVWMILERLGDDDGQEELEETVNCDTSHYEILTNDGRMVFELV